MARSSTTPHSSTSDVRDNNGKLRRNRHKRWNNSDNTEDTAVNAGFSGSKSGQRRKPFKCNNQGPSSLDRILERSCQIHGTPDKPANHTNRDCWVFKQTNKINAKNKDKGLHSDDDEEPRRPNTGGQKKFPPGENGQHDLRHPHPQAGTEASTAGRICDEPVVPKLNPWSACPITIDRRDHPTSIRHGGSAALVLDPIIDGFHLN